VQHDRPDEQFVAEAIREKLNQRPQR